MNSKTIQNLFFGWFMILSLLVVYTFYYVTTVSKQQEPLVKQYSENEKGYADAIKEHDQFKADINFLKGRVDGCTQR